MTADGLAPGQSWAIHWGVRWQARKGRDGRAHVIGLGLANHRVYGQQYVEPWRAGSGRRPSHTFARACRAAAMHERMVIAAKRNAAQSGRGGE